MPPFQGLGDRGPSTVGSRPRQRTERPAGAKTKRARSVRSAARGRGASVIDRVRCVAGAGRWVVGRGASALGGRACAGERGRSVSERCESAVERPRSAPERRGIVVERGHSALERLNSGAEADPCAGRMSGYAVGNADFIVTVPFSGDALLRASALLREICDRPRVRSTGAASFSSLPICALRSPQPPPPPRT